MDTYSFGASFCNVFSSTSTHCWGRCSSTNGEEKSVTNRILSEIEVLYGIKIAQAGLCEQSSDRMITVGGNYVVSLAPFTCLSR